MVVKNKKILFIGDLRSIHLQRYIQWFLEKGYTIVCISDYYADRLIFKRSKIKIYFKPQKVKVPLLRHFIQINRVKTIVKYEHPDIINAHFITEDGWYGALSGFHPVVLTAYGSDIYISPVNSRFYRFMNKMACSRSDRIIVDSKDQKKQLERLRIDPHKISVIHYGVDFNAYQRSQPSSLGALRKKWKIHRNDFVLLSMRHLHPLYNIDKIIEAFDLFHKTVARSRLIILGDGPDQYNLKNTVRMKNLNGKVHFTGLVRDVLPYIRLSEAVISIPNTDGMPLSVLEAMAAGKPVIVSDLPSLREIVAGNINGYRIKINHTQIVKSLLKLYKNRSVRKEMGRCNRILIRNKYDFPEQMTKIETLFSKTGA